MKCNPAGIAIIRECEGCKLKAYLCPAGKWTIGFGHTGPDVREGLVISQERAEDLLRQDVARFEIAIKQTVTAPLTESQFSALVPFCFNVIGWRDSTLIRLLNQKDYAGAAAEFPKWCHAHKPDGQVVVEPGLVTRRERERELFLA